MLIMGLHSSASLRPGLAGASSFPIVFLLSDSHSPGFPLSRSELAAIAPAAAAIGLRMFGLFLMLPVLAPHVLAMPGGSWRVAGLAAGAYGLTQACLLFPLGWLSDRIGRRPVMIGGLLVFAAGGFVAGAAESPVMVIAGRALQGCGAISAAALASVADSVSERGRTAGMAVVGIGVALSFVLAIILAGPLAAWMGVDGLLVFTGVLGLIAAAAVALSGRATKPAGSRPAAAGGLPVALALPCLGVFGIHALLAMLFVIVPVLLAELVGIEDIWQVYLPAFALALLPAGLLIMRAHAMPRLAAVMLPVVAAAALASAWAASAGVLPLAATLVVFFAGFCVLEAQLPAWASGLVGAAGRGRAMGVFAVCQAVGAFAGAAAVGLAGREYGIICLGTAATALALLAIVFFKNIDSFGEKK